MKIVVIIRKEVLKNDCVYNIKKIELFDRKFIRYYLFIIKYKMLGYEIDILDTR